ncbi:hypothetical protein B0H13DRAFT_2383903 [Mycena leptocephala]|nr:hypothetical protein B0H13DRAFT_2383903 [Mycena leptocephala]
MPLLSYLASQLSRLKGAHCCHRLFPRKASSSTRLSYHTLNRNRPAAHFPSHPTKCPASSVQMLCALPSNAAPPLPPPACARDRPLSACSRPLQPRRAYPTGAVAIHAATDSYRNLTARPRCSLPVAAPRPRLRPKPKLLILLLTLD